MADVLHVLIIEDSEDDAALMLHEVRRSGAAVVHARVSDEDGMCAALDRRAWDLVLSDHSLPRFDAPQALRLLRDRGIDIPFIVVSGRIGESLVVALMKAGASDYVRKDEIADLLPAIRRALHDARVSSERKRAQDGLEFLASASSMLARSLDPKVTLRATARLAVGRLADVCVVDLLEEDGRLEMTGLASSDASAEARMRDHRLSQIAAACRHPLFALSRPGTSRLVREVDDDVRRALALDAEATGGGAGEPIACGLFVPLTARGRTLGVIGMGRSTSRPSFDEIDQRIAEELGSRAAAAIDNTLLFRQAERARRSAETANRIKDEFLAIASHELRAPLTSILGWTRLLLSGKVPEEKRGRALKVIDRNATVQRKLLDDLVDFSRISTGHLFLETVPVDLARVVDTAVETVRPEAESKGVHLEARGPGDVLDLTTLGDAGRLQQVVANLLLNAVRFTPADGRVEVGLRKSRAHAELTVRDTGEGIDPEFLPFAFERFRQGDTGPGRAHNGLGLGLAIVKHLVELQRGEVEAHSEGKGRGSTFTIRLPLAPADSEPQPRKPAAAGTRASEPPNEITGLRILVVDDDEDARRLVEGILEPCGAEVLIAASVAEAVETHRRAPADILVSDICMPGETGCDLLRTIRALPPERGGTVPAVALSAYSRDEDREEALRAGFTDYLAKPVDPRELVLVLSRLATAR